MHLHLYRCSGSAGQYRPFMKRESAGGVTRFRRVFGGCSGVEGGAWEASARSGAVPFCLVVRLRFPAKDRIRDRAHHRRLKTLVGIGMASSPLTNPGENRIDRSFLSNARRKGEVRKATSNET